MLRVGLSLATVSNFFCIVNLAQQPVGTGHARIFHASYSAPLNKTWKLSHCTTNLIRQAESYLKH